MATASRPRRTNRSEQLAFLDLATGRRRVQLDPETRRVGIAGIAGVRAKLAEQAARRAEREAAIDGRFTHRPAA